MGEMLAEVGPLVDLIEQVGDARARLPSPAMSAGPAKFHKRSLKDVRHLMDRIAASGAGFRSLTEAIDTTTPAGRMMMQMVGSFAEFERAMIRERTTSGLAQARAEGRIGGRRKKLDPKKRREIAESVLSGRKSGAEMARLYDISEPTVSRIVAEHRQNMETSHADQP